MDMKKQKIITLILLLTLLSSAIRFEKQVISLFQKKHPAVASQIEKLKENTGVKLFKGACKMGEVIIDLTLK